MKTQRQPKLNVRLLRKIQKHILEEPRRFFMWDIIRKGKPGERYESDNEQMTSLPPCGTAACIAGWASILSGIRRPQSTRIAAKLIGLDTTMDSDNDFRSQADRVFLADDWPEPFNSRFVNARSPRVRAQIAAKRIEHLIKTGA